MALALDFLTQIINVHWADGPREFAIGGTARDTTAEGAIGVFYSQKPALGETLAWGHTHIDPTTSAPPAAVDEPAVVPRSPGLRFNYLTAMVGGRFKAEEEGQPDRVVLVAGGYRSHVISVTFPVSPSGAPGEYHYNHQTTGILFWSDDNGRTWTETQNPVTAPPGVSGNPAEPSGVNVDVSVLYLAFDPAAKRFLGDVIKIGNVQDDFFVERTTISSSDGKLWATGSTSRHPLPDPTLWASPFLGDIIGIENNGLTEVVNTDANPPVKLTYSTITVKPTGLGGILTLAPPWIITSGEGAGPVSGIAYGDKTAAGETSNKGFAYANGRFLIAGSLMATADNTRWDVIAYESKDKGKTWIKTLEDIGTFMTSDPFVEGGIGCAGSPGCAGA